MNKIGLVFAGGGGKGAYQIGVWKALKEFGVTDNIQGLSGTSVGALNSALFLQGDIRTAEEVWGSISNDKILSINAKTVTKILALLGLNPSGGKLAALFIKSLEDHGIFSREGLEEIIDEYLNISFITTSYVSFYATCLEKGFKNKLEYFKLNNCSKNRFKSILLATSAIPVVFGSEEIGGKEYIDGGFFGGDNNPVKPLYDEGFNLIFVVHLKRSSSVDHNQFPNAKIIEVFPQEDQGGFFNGTLDFSPESAKQRIKQGYKDMKDILDPIYKMAKTQAQFHQILMDIKKSEVQRRKVVKEREQLEKEFYELL